MNKAQLAIILSSILLSQVFTTYDVYGHATSEQTGNRVTVHADITSITVNWAKPVVDFNDGPDINGELTLQYSILESKHPEQMVTDTIQIDDWNYDLYQTYPVNKNQLRKAIPKHATYTHDTCHDLGEMHIHIMAVEEDKPDLGGFAKDRAKSAARSALMVLAGISEAAAATRGNVLSAMAAGVYWYMQENESLGSTIETINLSNDQNIGDKTITTTVTEYGSVTVNVRIWTEEHPDQKCVVSAEKKSATALSKDTGKRTKKSTTLNSDALVAVVGNEAKIIKNEIKTLYQISKYGEKFTSILKKANDDEAKALKKMSGDAKSIYSKTKNSDAKKIGDKIQVQLKDAEQDKKQISVLGEESKKITKQILSVAKENKITKAELDKATKDSKTDAKNQKPKENSNKPIDHGAIGTPLDLQLAADRLAEILSDEKSSDKQNAEEINKFIRDYGKLLEAKQNTENKPDDSKQKDPDAPPESLLDDLDPTIRGPDVNEPKPNKEKPDPKTEKPKTDQQNSDAPPESILDDIDTNYGADIGPKPDKPKSDQKPKQNSGIDHARIAQDDMRIIEESLRQELLDQVRDTQIQIDLERQLKDLKQKIVIDDTKKPIIQKDPTKLPETKTQKPKTEVKPKSTIPEKTEKPVIQQDPVITKPSNTKPTLSIPKQVTQEATGPAGANVAFSTSSQDKEDGSLAPVCSPASGTTFPIGATPVSCVVTDSNNNSVSGTFTVTVRDTTSPAFGPFQPTEGVKDDTGVQVFFDVTATDLVDGNTQVSCNYQSGYKFPPGVTELKCTTSDSRGNQSTKTVQITVTVTESG